MRAITAGGTFAAIAALVGCTTGPDYHAPTVALAPTYLATSRVVVGSQAISADWWNGFGDPQLTRLVEQALRDNQDIAQAAARVAQARAGLRMSEAALLPSGQVSANAGYAYQSLETPTGRALGAFPAFQRGTDLYDAGLGASWEIDFFGGLRRGREAARADWFASRAGLAAAQVAVAAETVDAYVAIRALQRRIGIAEEQEKTQARLTDVVGLRYRRGVAAEREWRQSEGALAQVRAGIPVLRAGLVAAMTSLDVLLGRAPGTAQTELAKPAAIPAPPPLGNVGTPADLLRRRPDVIAAEQRLIAANARIGQAMAEYYPKISLSALLGVAATAPRALVGGSAVQGQGFAGLRWRLFDFKRIDAEIAAARGRDAEALAAYRQAVLRATKDVEDALSAVVERGAQAHTLEIGETSLVRARDASQAAYRGGVISLFERLDADARLLATRDARAQADAARTEATIATFRALGGGWRPDHPAS